MSQLSLLKKPPRSRRYPSNVIHVALQLFLSSRSAYRTVSSFLALPSAITLKKHIGRFSSVGGHEECDSTISLVFSELNVGQKRCILLFDEVYVKPSIRYRGGHLIGYSVDEPTLPAKTILAIMVKPLYGSSAFVCRLLPVHVLKPDFLLEHLLRVVRMIVKYGGSVVGLICDNHPTNRSAYSSFPINSSSTSFGNCSDQPDETLHLIFDTVHLFKSVRNNWFTEKNKTLKMEIDGIVLIGNWNDIIRLYEKEKSSSVRRTSLSHAAVYPGPVDRQKTGLMTQVFDEKTVAALRMDGSTSTADFLELFVRCWKIVNIKDTSAHYKLRDQDRKPFYAVDDDRLTFLRSVAKSVALMRGGKGESRHQSLTSETRSAFVTTIVGLSNLIVYLLERDPTYVLTGHFQSDRLEAEFGVYRLVC